MTARTPLDHPRTQTGAPFIVRPESPEQRKRWQAAADRDGRKLVSWVRRALDEAAGGTKGRRRP
jgi:hypothetical protein